MKPDIIVETPDLDAFKEDLEKRSFDKSSLAGVAGTGALVVASSQKILCPVDTGATRASITPFWDVETATYIDMEIGPQTEYAPYIEFGLKTNPNYPAQPFIVPSATGRNKIKALRAMARAFKRVVEVL